MSPDYSGLTPELRKLFEEARDDFRWEVKQAIDKHRLRVTIGDMVDILYEESRRILQGEPNG